MRLLQVTNSLRSGGAEKLVVDTSILFKEEHQLEVDVLVLDGTETIFYKKLKDKGTVQIQKLGYGINMYNPLNIFKLRKYLKAYDVIHVHLFPAFYWIGLAKILTSSSCKLIITEHNTTNRRRENVFFKLMDRFIYRQYDKIITISDAVDQSVKKHLGPKFDSFQKIYNGIDLESVTSALPYSKTELGFSEDDILTIQVASFTPQKDQKTLIEAIQILPEQYKLILVGKGPEKEQMEAFVTEHNLDDKVKFFGVRSDVPKLLKSVDVVVLSSHFEGLSLSSVEGLASGKPFVASRAPGLEEVVEGAGVLFTTGDSQQLSKEIQQLVELSKIDRQKIVDDCVERSKRFDIQLMVKNYVDLYAALV